MTSPPLPRRILWTQVWGLALMQGAITLMWVIYNLYLVRLLQQFGFPAPLATALLVLENLLAAVMEPLMGSFSDRTQYSMGTRFPLIALGVVLSSALFVGVPLVVVFTRSLTGLRWLLPVLMVAWAIAMTLFRSPALSLLGRYAFRTQLPQAASILTLVGGVTGAMAPLAGDVILGIGPLFAFFLGSVTLLAATAALRAVGPNQRVMAEDESPLLDAGPDGESEPVTPALSVKKLGLIFGVGVGVALGFRLMMQVFPAIVAARAPGVNVGLILGCIFVAIALTAIPAGTIATRLGLRLSLVVGLSLMAVLSLLMGLSHNGPMAAVVAIALGTAFSLVSNTTLPFALSMVPPSKAGLGTGLYFSGGAVATSLYGMALSRGLEITPGVGMVVGAIAFAAAAGFGSVSRPLSSK